LSGLRGPWALAYWQSAVRTLWYGRDFVGRRSLVAHLPNKQDGRFLVSSVAVSRSVSKLGDLQVEADQQVNGLNHGVTDPDPGSTRGYGGLPKEEHKESGERWAGVLSSGNGTDLEQGGVGKRASGSGEAGSGGLEGEALFDFWVDVPSGIYSFRPENGAHAKHAWADPLVVRISQWKRKHVQPTPENGSDAVCGQLKSTPLFGESSAGAKHKAEAGAHSQERDSLGVERGRLTLVGEHRCGQAQPEECVEGAGDEGSDSGKECGLATPELLRSTENVGEKTVNNEVSGGEGLEVAAALDDFQSAAEQLLEALSTAVAKRVTGIRESAPFSSEVHGSESKEGIVLQAPEDPSENAVGIMLDTQNESASDGLRNGLRDVSLGASPSSSISSANPSWHQYTRRPAEVAVLFSGGLDSMVLAALVDKHVAVGAPIDLINVCFDGGMSPDRKSALAGLEELRGISPGRR
jgi:hypothetical protein